MISSKEDWVKAEIFSREAGQQIQSTRMQLRYWPTDPLRVASRVEHEAGAEIHSDHSLLLMCSGVQSSQQPSFRC